MIKIVKVIAVLAAFLNSCASREPTCMHDHEKSQSSVPHIYTVTYSEMVSTSYIEYFLAR